MDYKKSMLYTDDDAYSKHYHDLMFFGLVNGITCYAFVVVGLLHEIRIKQHGMHNKSQNSCYIRHEKQFPLRVMGGIWAVTYPLGKYRAYSLSGCSTYVNPE